MSITKFKTGGFSGGLIEAVQVEKETAQSVWINSWTFKGAGTGPARKHAKRSQYDNYFDTWQEAYQFLLERAISRVLSARRELDLANSHLGNVKGMKAPTP
jgi:hypothetical protein